MNMLYSLLRTGILLSAAAALPAQNMVALRGNPPFAWPSEEGARNVNKQQVLTLLRSANDPVLSPVYDVASYRFARLAPGSPYLVAIVDTSGRNLFFSLQLIRCTGNTCSVAALQSDPPHDLSQEIVDVNGDGMSEIIVKELAGGYEGTRTRPIYTYSIYALQNGTPVDVTARYPDYFEAHILPAMRRAKADVETRYAGDLAELAGARAEVAFTFAKYRREVRGERNAGLSDALGWAASSDPKLQDLAVRTLESIDAPEAAAGLENLRSSGNLVVSGAARMALERRASRALRK